MPVTITATAAPIQCAYLRTTSIMIYLSFAAALAATSEKLGPTASEHALMHFRNILIQRHRRPSLMFTRDPLLAFIDNSCIVVPSRRRTAVSSSIR